MPEPNTPDTTTPPPPHDPKLPDTMWGVAALLAQKLGPLAVVIGAACFAIYKFNEQSSQFAVELEKQRTDATAKVQAQLNDSYAQLRETYAAIGDMHNTTLGNIQSAMNTLSNLQAQSTQAAEEADLAAKNAELANQRLIELQNELKLVETESRKQIEAALKNKRKELERIEQQTREARKSTATKQGQFESEVRKLIELIELIDSEAASPSQPAEALQLAQRIRSTYLISDDDLKTILSALTDEDTNKVSNQLKKLSGLEVNKFITFVPANPPDHTSWYRMDSTAENDAPASDNLLLAIINTDNPRIIQIYWNQQDNRIYEADFLSNYALTALPSLTDWYDRRVKALYQDSFTEFDSMDIPWRISDAYIERGKVQFETLVENSYQGVTPNLIAGNPADIPIVTLNDYFDKHPNARHALTAWDDKLELTASMIAREKKLHRFDAPPAAFGRQTDLYKAVNKLFIAAVKNDKELRTNVAEAEFTDWGPLCAALLRPATVDGVTLDPKTKTASVRLRYQQLWSIDQARGAELFFLKNDKPDTTTAWRFSDFEYLQDLPTKPRSMMGALKSFDMQIQRQPRQQIQPTTPPPGAE